MPEFHRDARPANHRVNRPAPHSTTLAEPGPRQEPLLVRRSDDQVPGPAPGPPTMGGTCWMDDNQTRRSPRVALTAKQVSTAEGSELLKKLLGRSWLMAG